MRVRYSICVGLLLVTACTQDDPSEVAPGMSSGGSQADTNVSAAGHNLDACGLLTSEEVASLLGSTVEGTNDDFSGYDSACTWELADANGMRQEITMELGHLDAESARQEYETYKTTMTHREEIGSLGDDAFLAGYGAEGAAVIARSGTLLVLLSTTVPGKEAVLRELAATVLQRVEG